jgi:hypothetical protein
MIDVDHVISSPYNVRTERIKIELPLTKVTLLLPTLPSGGHPWKVFAYQRESFIQIVRRAPADVSARRRGGRGYGRVDKREK